MKYTIYKPNKSGTGSAYQFECSPERGVWLVCARQVGVGDDGFARFGWNEKLIVKLGLADVGALLVGGSCSLFHRYGEHTTAIKVEWRDDGSSAWRVSRAADNWVGIVVSPSEWQLVWRVLDTGARYLMELEDA